MVLCAIILMDSLASRRMFGGQVSMTRLMWSKTTQIYFYETTSLKTVMMMNVALDECTFFL